MTVLALAATHCKGSGPGGGGSSSESAVDSGSSGSTMTTGGDAAAGDDGAPPATPPTFAGITGATTIDESHVAITWDPATDAATAAGSMVYRVYAGAMSGAEDFSHPVATTPAGATGALVGGLRGATGYYFVVRAVDARGLEDSNTAERSATTTDTTPPIFAGVQSVTGTDRDQMVVTWNAARDNSGANVSYRIFASSTQGGEDFTKPAATAPTGSTQYTLTGLSEATTYFVVVRAVDASGNSDTNVRELRGTTLDKTPPVFAGATSVATLGTTLTVSWSAATDNVDPPPALLYNVYMATKAGGEDFTTPTFTTAAGATGYSAPHLDVSTTYYFVVRAQDSSKNEDKNTHEVSGKTAASPDITPPQFAGLAAATGTSDTTVDLSWVAAKDDYSAAADILYDIYVASMAGGETYSAPTYTTDPGATSFTITGLKPQQTEYFVVRARDQAGNEDTNSQQKAATSLADTVPPQFGGLTTVNATTPTTVELAWNPASDDVSAYTNIIYRLYMGTSAGGEGSTPIVTTVAAATQFVVTGLNPKTTYYFYARAVDEAGNPDTTIPPVELQATTPPDTTAPTFGGVSSLASTDPQTLTAGWAAATDYVTPSANIAYRAYIAAASGQELSTTPVVTAAGATNVTFTGLAPNTTYFVIVHAVDAAGNEDTNATELSAKTLPDTTPPTFAGAASVGSATDSTLKVTWAAASDKVTPANAIRYLVCMTTTSGGCNGASFSTVATVTGGVLTYQATGLAPNTTYYFVVQSVDQAGNNDGNNKQVTGTTAKDLIAPVFSTGTGLTATTLGDASIRLDWRAAIDDITPSAQLVYDIFQATAANGEVFSSPSYTTAAGATSYTIPQQYPPLLQPNQTYHFVVRARDQAGNEDGNTTDASATTLPDTTPPSFSGASNISPPSSLTQLTVNWSAASDDITAPSAIVYDICWATDDSCATSFVVDATTAAAAVTYNITGLSAATSYHVLVKARDGAGNRSANTTTQIASTLADTTAPTFGGASGCSNASATALTVNWALATDNYSAQAALRYQVCISGASNGCGGAGGPFSPSATVTNVTSYTFNTLSPTTTYYFVVRAQDEAGNVDTNYNVVSGQTVIDTTPPTFAGLTSVVPAAGNLGDGNFTLTWPAASDNVSSPSQIAYDIYQSTTAGGEATNGTPTYSAPAGTTSITVPLTTPALLPNSTYYFVVRARDTAGNRSSTPYKELSSTTGADHVSPTFPGGITSLTAFSDTQLTASWTANATDDTTPTAQIAYEVCWNVHGAPSPCTTNFSSMATTAAGATSYTNAVRALSPNTNYDFVVRARDASGNTDSNVVSLSAVTPADTVAPTFTGASSVNGASLTTLTVNWPSATDDVTASGSIVYDICKTTSSGGCTAFTTSGGATGVSGNSYQFTGLLDHTPYYFVVRARDQAGNEETNTTQVSGTTLADTTAPTFVGLSGVGSATTTTLGLSWGLATDNYSAQTNIKFSIYQSTGKGGENYTSATYSGLTQTSGSTNTFTVTSLSPNTLYCFVVRASDEAGNQETNTTEVCGTTMQIPPPTFTAQPTVTPTYTSLSVSWAATVSPSSTITYSICTTTTSGGCSAGTYVSLGTSTTRLLSGLTPSQTGLTYYFVVKATDAGGTTTSNQATGTTTPDTTAPSVPTGFSVATNASYPTGINYYWSDSTDNASAQANIGYQLCNTGCSPTYTIAAGGGVLVTSSYLGNGASGLHGSALASNTTQAFWIRAIDEAGNASSWAPSVNGTTAVSFANDVTPIITICNGCHTAPGYTPGPFSYSFWMGTTPQSGSDCNPLGKSWIVAYSPGSSLIYQRMAGQIVSGCTLSDQMPKYGPYPAANITTMYNWIYQGAVNN